MVVWLVGLVGGFKMPLPSSRPIEFACVPEHFVGDAIEMLIAIFTFSESLSDVVPEMDEFMKFIIMFVASPNYIQNSYIRQRMVELLDLCIRNRRFSSSAITILEGSQLCLEFLVRNLLELYSGKEFIGSPNKIVSIYVHLARGDSENIFAASISKANQSCTVQLFIDVARVLHEDSLVPEFIELGDRVSDAALKAIETEASLGEIPNDFLDPIEFKLMEDPVILPSTKSVDRAVIQRHLLNYNTDPFNGLPPAQKMLIPNVELKAKIEKFIISKQSQE